AVLQTGFDEERYISYLEAGRLASDQDMLLRAHKLRPHRWEAPYEMAKLSNQHGKWNSALHWCHVGLQLPSECPDLLFIERWIKDWALDFELSVALYWLGARSNAATLNEKLLARTDLPAVYRTQIERNLEFCR